VLVLGAIPVLLAIVAWTFSIANLVMTTTPSRFTVGHVVAGLALICTSLIASGASSAKCRTHTANGIGSRGPGS
jgi:hypothetical protein